MLQFHRNRKTRAIVTKLAIASMVLCGVISSCSNSLGNVAEYTTRYFDPCGTIFNCEPGSFQLQFADVPDWRVDPTCTIPGGCVDDGDPFESPYDQLGPGFDGP